MIRAAGRPGTTMVRFVRAATAVAAMISARELLPAESAQTAGALECRHMMLGSENHDRT
ncbi:MAG: hypothetical protein AAB268_10480 [Elusimicrobiota bacterium]